MRVVALAASSLETCFAVRFDPTACRFWRNCSSLPAPIPGCVEATRTRPAAHAGCEAVVGSNQVVGENAHAKIVS